MPGVVDIERPARVRLMASKNQSETDPLAAREALHPLCSNWYGSEVMKHAVKADSGAQRQPSAARRSANHSETDMSPRQSAERALIHAVFGEAEGMSPRRLSWRKPEARPPGGLPTAALQREIDPDFLTWLGKRVATRDLLQEYLRNFFHPEFRRAKVIGLTEELQAEFKTFLEVYAACKTDATQVDVAVALLSALVDKVNNVLNQAAAEDVGVLRGQQEQHVLTREKALATKRAQLQEHQDWIAVKGRDPASRKGAIEQLQREIGDLENQAREDRWRLARLERRGVMTPVAENPRSEEARRAPLDSEPETPMKLVRGFKSAAEGEQRLAVLHGIFRSFGVTDAVVGIRGSAVRGWNVEWNRAYREGDSASSIGDVSDHDYNFTSPTIMAVVKQFGDVKPGGSMYPHELLDLLKNDKHVIAKLGHRGIDSVALAKALEAFSEQSVEITGRKSDIAINTMEAKDSDPHGGVYSEPATPSSSASGKSEPERSSSTASKYQPFVDLKWVWDSKGKPPSAVIRNAADGAFYHGEIILINGIEFRVLLQNDTSFGGAPKCSEVVAVVPRLRGG